MSKLLVKPQPADERGRVLNITPASAGWRYVGFEVYHLAAGQQLDCQYEHEEVCLVWLSGKAEVEAGGQALGELGQRMSLFEQTPPYALYLPPGTPVCLQASTALELAVCKAPAQQGMPLRLITPAQVPVMVRGQGSNLRHIHNILMGEHPAESLLITEVYTPAGHWSSYPPHKHDTDNLPAESYLEETYYHRLNPAQGFAFQRVYTDDRSLDETLSVEDGQVVLVPRGYHPVGAPHGYDLYYLNVMAGPSRQWQFHNDPAHAWMLTR
ncbi:5-deoxy-glucuronate isomerase [Balneatrix alpica]|uniref:5-deoxy-glucuronate isomerase n=1 Tax=Balneatrix alpica TaxID=75684 RepID=UPI002738B1B5|nr:5-deoxy-glucuronate isomerase [Balneatrix alpica]